MSEPVSRWRVTYTPGSWVVLSGPASIVIMQPAPPRSSNLVNALWADVVEARTVAELAQTLSAFGLEAMPHLAAFFWGPEGMRSLVRGRLRVVDLDAGTVVADGSGFVTWTEVGLAGVKRVRVDMQPIDQNSVLQLPLIVGGVLASAVQIDATDQVALQFPSAAQAQAEQEAGEAIAARAEAPANQTSSIVAVAGGAAGGMAVVGPAGEDAVTPVGGPGGEGLAVEQSAEEADTAESPTDEPEAGTSRADEPVAPEPEAVAPEDEAPEDEAPRSDQRDQRTGDDVAAEAWEGDVRERPEPVAEAAPGADQGEPRPDEPEAAAQNPAEPAVLESADAERADSASADSESAAGESADAERADSESAAGEPAAVEPPDSAPGDAQPSVGEPEVPESAPATESDLAGEEVPGRAEPYEPAERVAASTPPSQQQTVAGSTEPAAQPGDAQVGASEHAPQRELTPETPEPESTHESTESSRDTPEPESSRDTPEPELSRDEHSDLPAGPVDLTVPDAPPAPAPVSMELDRQDAPAGPPPMPGLGLGGVVSPAPIPPAAPGLNLPGPVPPAPPAPSGMPLPPRPVAPQAGGPQSPWQPASGQFAPAAPGQQPPQGPPSAGQPSWPQSGPGRPPQQQQPGGPAFPTGSPAFPPGQQGAFPPGQQGAFPPGPQGGFPPGPQGRPSGPQGGFPPGPQGRPSAPGSPGAFAPAPYPGAPAGPGNFPGQQPPPGPRGQAPFAPPWAPPGGPAPQPGGQVSGPQAWPGSPPPAAPQGPAAPGRPVGAPGGAFISATEPTGPIGSPAFPRSPGGVIAGVPSFGGSPREYSPSIRDDQDGDTIFATSLAATHRPGQAEQNLPEGSVLAAMCANFHPNPPDARVCLRCGGTVDPSSTRLVPKPALARLQTTTGQQADLMGTILLGRAPSAQPTDRDPVLVAVPSPSQDISRTHLRFAAVGWDVVVTDLHSTNGTVLVRPGEGPTQLRPGEPVVVGYGAILDLGDGVQIRVGEPG